MCSAGNALGSEEEARYTFFLFFDVSGGFTVGTISLAGGGILMMEGWNINAAAHHVWCV